MSLVCTCPSGHRWEHDLPDDAGGVALACPECGALAAAVTEIPPAPPAEATLNVPVDPRALSRDAAQSAAPHFAPAPPEPSSPPRPRPPAPGPRPHHSPPRSATGPVLLGVGITAVVMLAAGGLLFVLFSAQATERNRRNEMMERERQAQVAQAVAEARHAAAMAQRAGQDLRDELAQAQQQLRQEQNARQQLAAQARDLEMQVRSERDRRTELERNVQAKVDALLKQTEAARLKELAELRERTDAELYTARVALADWELRNRNVERASSNLKLCPQGLRHWEWHYLNRACNAEVAIFRQHTGPVRAVAFTPDGARALSAGDDTIVRMWDAASGKSLRTLPTGGGPVLALAVMPNGKRFVTAAGTARVCDLDSGRVLVTFSLHKGGILALALSGDGKLAITGGADGTARVWETDTGKELASFKHRGKVQAVAFAADGRLVASGSDGEAVLWEPETGKEVARAPAVEGAVTALAIADGSRLLLAGTSAGKLHTWPFEEDTLKPSKPAVALTGPARGIVMSADGKILYAATDLGVQAWQRPSGTNLRSYRGHAGPITSLALSPDGSRLLTGSADRSARVWDTSPAGDGVMLKAHTGPANDATFSPDGAVLVTCGADSLIRFWDPRTGKSLRTLAGHKLPVAQVSFSGDGRRLVSVSDPPAGGGAVEVKVWDVAAGKPLLTVAGPAGPHASAALSRDGSRLAVAGPKIPLRVFNVENGDEEPKASQWRGLAAGAPADCVAASPDGSRLAFGRADGTVTVVHVSDGAARAEVKRVDLTPLQVGPVLGLSWSADGKHLVAVSQGRKAVWDTEGRKTVGRLVGTRIDPRGSALSPDGKRLATAGASAATLWQLGPLQHLMMARAPKAGPVNALAFSPDGRLLVATFEDGRAVIWDGSPGPGKP